MTAIDREALRELEPEIAEAEQRADDAQLEALERWLAIREAARAVANDGGSDGTA